MTKDGSIVSTAEISQLYNEEIPKQTNHRNLFKFQEVKGLSELTSYKVIKTENTLI
jgi:hypothetical protein